MKWTYAIGFIDPKEEIFYEPHESRVDGDRYILWMISVWFVCRYQAKVPDFNDEPTVERFCREDIVKQCVSIPEETVHLHTSCMYDPSVLTCIEENDVVFGVLI